MQVIPVLDLMGGRVVRARLGARERYAPIETPLAPSSDPVDVARGLMSVHSFSALYVADLDAITGVGDGGDTVARLREAFPHVCLWVDNGIADPAVAAAWLEADLGRLVIGSESQADPALVRQFAGDDRVVLSLDFRGDAFQGPAPLLAEPDAWPARVIVMTLGRVGSGAGPDLERFRTIRDAARGRRIYAAGGVRDTADLAALGRTGAAGALVATSLHDGRLTGREIAAL